MTVTVTAVLVTAVTVRLTAMPVTVTVTVTTVTVWFLIIRCDSKQSAVRVSCLLGSFVVNKKSEYFRGAICQTQCAVVH